VISNSGSSVLKLMVGPSFQRRSTDSVEPLKVDLVRAMSMFTFSWSRVMRVPPANW
jgi:hypothetical protein